MLPRCCRLPTLDSGREFSRMSQTDFVLLVNYTCRLGPEANGMWTRETYNRHRSRVPLRHQASDGMATFLRRTCQSQIWAPETHLNAVPGFDGYQREFASLIKHVLQESRILGDLREEWLARLAAWKVEDQGLDPRRHGARVLDAFFRAPSEKDQGGHMDTYPGMVEARGDHGDWTADPAHTPIDPRNDVSLPYDIAPATRMPKLPHSLMPWVGKQVARMPRATLIDAVTHYRDSGPLVFGEFRRFAATAHSPPKGAENDVSGWSVRDLQALLLDKLGPIYPDHGLQNRDWDPQQSAPADAVLHANQTGERANKEWKRHVGSQLQNTVGNHPRRHSKRVLAANLSMTGSGRAGEGLLRTFNTP